MQAHRLDVALDRLLVPLVRLGFLAPRAPRRPELKADGEHDGGGAEAEHEVHPAIVRADPIPASADLKLHTELRRLWCRPRMRRLMPAIYTVIIAAETAAFAWRWSTDPPAPTSALSVGLGWVGLGSMVVMLIYSVARRSRALRAMARLSAWLHFHIFLGVQGMVCVVFHSMHLFTRAYGVNLLNPAVLNFIAVAIVFFSGLFGRYLYSFLPRTLGGEQMAARDVEGELAKLGALPAEAQALLPTGSVPRAFSGLLRADLQTRRALRKLPSLKLLPEAQLLVERRLKLQSRLHALGAAEKIFQRWIVLHRPLASIMYILSVVHVVLSYMYAMSFTSE